MAVSALVPGRRLATLSTGVGAPVTPVTILGSSLRGWWTADRADLMTLAGSLVASWKDVVAAYDVSQATSGFRPVYDALGFGGFAPGVTSDGLDDFLRLAAQPFPTVATPSVMFVVIDQTALPADTAVRSLFGYGATSASQGRQIRRIVTGGVNRMRSLTSGVNVDGTVVDLSGRHVMHAVFGATTLSQDVDNTPDGSGAAVPNTGTTQVSLFSDNGGTPTLFWKGSARDVLVTDGNMTADQLTALNAWLAARRNP